MRATPKPQGKATYVANQLDKSWLLSEQKKLHKRSLENPAYIFCKLWGLVTDLRNLRVAFERVARNKGRRTAGVDGVTVKAVLRRGFEPFVAQVRPRDALRCIPAQSGTTGPHSQAGPTREISAPGDPHRQR